MATNKVIQTEERQEQSTISTETVTVHLDFRRHTVLVGMADMQPDLTHRKQLMNQLDRAVIAITKMMMTTANIESSG